MASEKFDCIVVGAGPAGTAAALTLARAGISTVLLERGAYPGAKNVQGAVLYTKMLSDIVPDFWKEPDVPPLERPITEQRVWILTEDSGISVSYKSEKFLQEPHNCYTILRTPFDGWFAKKAESAGAMLVTGMTVTEVLKQGTKVTGVKTHDGEELLCDCLIAADGVNSLVSQKAGLHREWKSSEVALGVKEILSLPREKIEDRFNLEQGEGSTTEMFGKITQGMLGYAFLYTNKETLSLGIGCKLSDFQKTLIKPYELLEQVKNHPFVRRAISGSTSVEYSAHLIPEGGYNSLPPLYADGILVAGDAAQMVNPTHREGSNLAMTSGLLAAQTVIEAKQKNDFSAAILSSYKRRLEESYVLQDLKEFRDIEKNVEKRPEVLTIYPELLCELAHLRFEVDGRSKRQHRKQVLKTILAKRKPWKMLADFWALRKAAG